MGTNFYFGKDIHIGKRSAAGLYCWDCGVSLALEAYDRWEDRIRYGGDAVHYDGKWSDCCPICGKTSDSESWNSAVGRELGFNEEVPMAKTGVKSCSSFSWAISPKKFQERFLNSGESVFDEYGGKFTRDEFRAILDECPIRRYASVGKEFS